MPVLKAKRGEFWALQYLWDRTREAITPVMELVPHKAKGAQENVKERARDLAKVWRDRPVFLDTHFLREGGEDEVVAFQALFEACRLHGVSSVPVDSLNKSVSHHHAVREAGHADGRGVMLRLYLPDFQDPSRMAAAVDGWPGLWGRLLSRLTC